MFKYLILGLGILTINSASFGASDSQLNCQVDSDDALLGRSFTLNLNQESAALTSDDLGVCVGRLSEDVESFSAQVTSDDCELEDETYVAIPSALLNRRMDSGTVYVSDEETGAFYQCDTSRSKK